MTDIEKKRQEIREGVARIIINRTLTEHKYCSSYEIADQILRYQDSQGVGYRVDLKIPENPHKGDIDFHQNIRLARRQGFDDAIQKFLELNDGGFEPLKEGG